MRKLSKKIKGQVDEVIAHLKNLPKGYLYDQTAEFVEVRDGKRGCGTYCCIAGHAAMVSLAKDETNILDKLQVLTKNELNPFTPLSGVLTLAGVAGDFLGLEFRCQRRKMFSTYPSECVKDVDINMAIAMLEHYRDTGEIDWDAGLRT